ncbi:MAG: hypothetical protein CL866_06460 [Cycloclasticus sp.]|nr:hypothetical protein [Cycloclasticus sp.]MBG96496.1 hypothetical protein [Cycloclasticus sp.]
MVIVGDSHVRAFGFQEGYTPIFLGPGKSYNFTSYESALKVKSSLLKIANLIRGEELLLLFGEPDTRFALGKSWHSWEYNEYPDDVNNSAFIHNCVDRYVLVQQEIIKTFSNNVRILAPMMTQNPNQGVYLRAYNKLLKERSLFEVIDINNEISNKAVLKPEFRKDIIHANSNVVRYLSHLLRDNTTSLNFQSQLLMFNYHFGCYQFNNQRRSLVSRVKGLML